jgi:hypothetical protein
LDKLSGGLTGKWRREWCWTLQPLNIHAGPILQCLAKLFFFKQLWQNFSVWVNSNRSW